MKAATNEKAERKKRAEEAALSRIPGMDDADGLRTLMSNAKDQDSTIVFNAAFRRLIDLLPGEAPGSADYDFWRSTFVYEELLAEQSGKKTAVTRVRQKVKRVGVDKTIEELATAKSDGDGFGILIKRGMPELTAEAVVVRHADRFSPGVVETAKSRLAAAGVAAFGEQP
jgi:hypothetical protein